MYKLWSSKPGDSWDNGRTLRVYRTTAMLTQHEMAHRLGLNADQLDGLERGHRQCSGRAWASLLRVAQVVSEAELKRLREHEVQRAYAHIGKP